MKRKLSKNVLKREYLVNKLSSYQIAKRYGYTATWINTLRKKYNIPALKSHERKEDIPLSQAQKEYIYGALLGDACLKKDTGNGNAYLSIGQINLQYVKWQYKIMKNFVRSKIKIYKKQTRSNLYYFYTISHPNFTRIYHLVYPNGRKRITNGWIRNLTPRSLAFWYMDDGSITRSTHQMRISTESFTQEELRLLQRFLFKKWGMIAEIKPSPAEGKFLMLFHAKERDKFFSLIKQYIIPAMRYKICEPSNWKKWQPKEIRYLSRNYSGRETNWKGVLAKLDRAKSAVLRKASYLGLTGR
jgi:hypothetical protein